MAPLSLLFVDASRRLWGTEQALLALAIGCARAGHRVVAVVRADSEMALAMRSIPGIELHETPFRGGEDPRAFRCILRQARAARTEWLVAAHGKHHWPLLIAARLLGCRFAAFRHMAYIRSRLTRYWMPRLADRYFVVSQFARDRLVADGVPEACLRISRNPIDTARFRPDPSARRALHAVLGVPAQGALVGFVGRLTPCKGVPVLRQAMIETMAERPHLHMLWVGEGVELAATRALVDAVGQADRHHFIVWRADIEAIYPALDVLLCPSVIEETFGRVAAEAQACGVPVIVRDRGGLPETMVDGRTGLLWRGDDADSLADALRMLLDDPARRGAMAEAASRHAGRFDTAAAVREFIEQLR